MTNYQFLAPENTRFIGLGNYSEALRDPIFWKAMGNSAYFLILNIPLAVVLPLFLAVMINTGLKGGTFFRTSFLIPCMLSVSVVALIWMWIYNPVYGILNDFLRRIFSLSLKTSLLGTPQWAMPSLALVSVWLRLGYSTLFYLVGLSDISPDLYEAASIDGATSWQSLTRITLPLLKPSFAIVFLIVTVNSLRELALMKVMTEGGPVQSTLTAMLYVYKVAFQLGNWRLGYASALALILSGVIGILSLLYFTAMYGEKR
ncbi:MAG: sugar ABC transporter permease [Firmicutes bacterium]|nr:sugar ABC transporter permease [Bacillota bacterium]